MLLSHPLPCCPCFCCCSCTPHTTQEKHFASDTDRQRCSNQARLPKSAAGRGGAPRSPSVLSVQHSTRT
uniref:Uncharacterized protein n=1 Tax=Arundo donax TaxID=35708 RepID=A0A0A9DFG4_ARUDO